jgi:uncharacterized repeat protein (TIGR01451 family)
MKFHTKLLAAALLLGGTQTAFAVDYGTNAGVSIHNAATVDYSVNGTAQTQNDDGQADFLVDRKVDLDVQNDAGATVSPNATGQMLSFTVTNQTNGPIDIRLSTQQLSSDFEPGSLEIWVDTNGNGTLETTDPDGVGPDEADTQQSYLDEVGEDVGVAVFVVGDIPDEGDDPLVQDHDTSDIVLIATAAEAGTADTLGADLAENTGADDPAQIDNVFADAAGTAVEDVPNSIAEDVAEDGRHSDTGIFTVGAADITVTKSYKVIWENYDAGTPGNSSNYSAAGEADASLKPVPGALVQYCILVTNAGSEDATDVTVNDDLSDLLDDSGTPLDTSDGPMSYLAGSIVTNATCDYAGGTGEDDNATDDDPDGVGPQTTDEGGAPPGGDLVGGDYDQTQSGTITVTAGDVPANNGTDDGSFAVMFRMIVK